MKITETELELKASNAAEAIGYSVYDPAGLAFQEGFIKGFQAAEQSQQWVPVAERLPEKGDKVLIIIDVRRWNPLRKLRIEIADVGFFHEPTRIGGPISLTGYKTIQGIYFAIPAIMHPDAVTHWQPLPSPPQTETGSNHPKG